ncbi:MHC class I polypeptide-related sequence B-like [Saimiri boliviensis]|uniref:MHC class I polypeptide-related sequence B-like n=1 Tax=Saimiri boliviensis TaxID=27679 RepID=UPI003D77C3B9
MSRDPLHRRPHPTTPARAAPTAAGTALYALCCRRKEHRKNERQKVGENVSAAHACNPSTLEGREPHSLRYILTVLSQDGSERSEFLAKVQLDGQPFLHYDGQNCTVEAVVRAQPCHREIEDLKENEKDLKMTLADIKKKKGALHSLQEIRLCEIHEDNSAKGIRHFYCDGELFLSQNLNTQEWTVPESSGAQILSINIMNDLKENAKKGGAVLADCRQKLLGYLESGVCIRRTVPPMVNVTRSEDSEGNINVTCWAFDFCPPNITLTWRQDGVSLSHDAQQSEGVLLDGNGTYRTWVTISIRQGEEQRFTCYAEYNGKVLVFEIQQPANPHVPTAAVPAPDIFAVIAVVIAGVITVAIIAVIRCCNLRCKKRTSRAEGPELMSLQVLDQHVVGTGDHRDAAQLGSQPLMSAPGPTGSTEDTETLQPGS